MCPSSPDVDPWNRAPRSRCGNKKFGCYFEALSSCSIAAESLAELDTLPLLDLSLMAKVRRSTDTDAWRATLYTAVRLRALVCLYVCEFGYSKRTELSWSL
jgi:hypothetical protein